MSQELQQFHSILYEGLNKIYEIECQHVDKWLQKKRDSKQWFPYRNKKDILREIWEDERLQKEALDKKRVHEANLRTIPTETYNKMKSDVGDLARSIAECDGIKARTVMHRVSEMRMMLEEIQYIMKALIEVNKQFPLRPYKHPYWSEVEKQYKKLKSYNDNSDPISIRTARLLSTT